MNRREIPPLRDAMPSVATALAQASLSLRRGDLPGAVYWVRVAAELDEDEPLPV